jgi:hypothetical protein
MSGLEESGFRSAEDLFNEACRTRDEQTPYGLLSRNFLIITRDLQELADFRTRPKLTPEDVEVAVAAMTVPLPDGEGLTSQEQAVVAKLRAIADGPAGG